MNGSPIFLFAVLKMKLKMEPEQVLEQAVKGWARLDWAPLC